MFLSLQPTAICLPWLMNRMQSRMSWAYVQLMVLVRLNWGDSDDYTIMFCSSLVVRNFCGFAWTTLVFMVYFSFSTSKSFFLVDHCD